MEEEFICKGGDACPQLLDLIPNGRDWRDGGVGGEGWKKRGEFRGMEGGGEEEEDLELRLGLPGGNDQSSSPVLSLGFCIESSKNINISCAGAKRGFLDTVENPNEDLKKQGQGCFFHLQNRAGFGKEMPQQTNGGKGEQQEQKCLDKKVAHASAVNDAAGANSSSQTRNSSAPVVGWPPIRSFRKNLASTSSKPSVEQPPPNCNTDNMAKLEESKKGLLVKINMDGIPIGRKVDLKSFDSYGKLSFAVEELFQGLLAAQMELSSAETNNAEKNQVFAGLLDGTGQYTLVYEDSEGDRMLVGDVPWDMFLSTAKRLRVLKSSDLSALRLGAMSRTKTTDC